MKLGVQPYSRVCSYRCLIRAIHSAPYLSVGYSLPEIGFTSRARAGAAKEAARRHFVFSVRELLIVVEMVEGVCVVVVVVPGLFLFSPPQTLFSPSFVRQDPSLPREL